MMQCLGGLPRSSDNHRSRVPDMAHVRESSQGLDGLQTNWGELDGSRDGDSAWLQVGRRVWEKDGGIGGCACFYDGGCGGPGSSQ
jgi:hypothetical protein